MYSVGNSIKIVIRSGILKFWNSAGRDIRIMDSPNTRRVTGSVVADPSGLARN
jgi:hypothetical protein